MSAPQEQFLALVITDGWVATAVWQMVGERASISAESPRIARADSSDPTLSAAIDQALDTLGEAGLSLKHIAYIIPSSWVENGDLATKQKQFLKTLSKDLLLDALGFTVISDTIVASLQENHGAFTGTVLFEAHDSYEAAHFINGEEQHHESIGKSGEATADQTELIARLKSVASPRIVFVDLTDPEVSPTEHSTVGALEKALGITVELLTNDHVLRSALTLGGPHILASTNPETPPAEAAPALPAQKDPDAPLLNGFAPPAFAKPGSLPNQPEPHYAINPSKIAEADQEGEELVEDDLENVEPVSHPLKKPLLRFALPKIHLPKFQMGSPKKQLPLLLGGGVGIAFLGLIGVFLWLQMTYTATVQVWLKNQELSENIEVSLNTSGAASDSASIPGELITESVVLDKEVPTTGSKVIGDPAKGTVTIYNKTQQSKTFPAGTKLTVNGMAFTLDEATTIASASSGVSSTQHGSVKTKVTASAIGPDGNLAAKQRLSVANFDSSSYEAENEAAFEGGSKREIQAVAQKDVDAATNDLIGAAKEQLAQKILALEKKPREVIVFLEKTELVEAKPSVKVGEESKFVRVAVEVKGTGIRVSPENIDEFAQNLFGSKVENAWTILPESTTLTPDGVAPTGDKAKPTYVLRGNIKTKAVPHASASELAQKIAGMAVGRAQIELTSTGTLEKSNITFSPSIIGSILNKLPPQNRIQINIRIDQSK